jgi:hypothetical protein
MTDTQDDLEDGLKHNPWSVETVEQFLYYNCPGMAIQVVEFSNGGYKIRKIFVYESTYSKEIIEF